MLQAEHQDPVPFGKYLLERRIAVGGMAEVFLAQLPGPDAFRKRVVVKRLFEHLNEDVAAREMFLDEARLAAQFHHPNLVQVFELARIERRYCLVMELVAGPDVAQIISKARVSGQSIPVPVVLAVITQAASGLAYAHRLRGEDGRGLAVVHRDVSPQNLLVSRDGVVKVADFGIAKYRGSQTTREGFVKGKALYMAPEQAAMADIDARTDIYALGVVLFELLTLTTLHPERMAPFDLIEHIAKGPRVDERLSSVPADLRDVLRDMLDPVPAKRPRTMDAVLERLQMVPNAMQVVERYMADAFADSHELRTLHPRESAALRPRLKNPTVELSLADIREATDEVDTAQLMPGEMVGEYRIEGFVAEGGMGVVYKALHPVIGKQVAVKVLSADLCRDATMLERFLLEARVVNAIRHPNVVDIFAFGSLSNGQRYLVMEWLDGEALDQRLTRGAPLSTDEVYAILVPVMDALAAAHAKNVVHRDLKPANIFLAREGSALTVKLLDFGIAKLVGSASALEDDPTTPATPTTRAGAILGTPGYLAPEQARGESVGPHSDVYSLGVVIYLLLLGERPFEGRNVIELLHKQLHVGPRSPREIWGQIPADFERLLLAMLAPNAADRPTLGRVRDDLRVMWPKISGLTRIRAAGRARRPRKRAYALAAALAAGLAILAGLGVYALRKSAPEAPADTVSHVAPLEPAFTRPIEADAAKPADAVVTKPAETPASVEAPKKQRKRPPSKTPSNLDDNTLNPFKH